MNNQLHSIVIPVYNSREILSSLVARIAAVMEETGLKFELVLVDDGSKDGSYGRIKELASKHEFIRAFRLSRNFGHQAALTIGLKKSRGEYVTIMDDDLQDPPEILPEFFHAMKKGADVVYGIRRKRKENLIKKILYSFFYKILTFLSSIEIPLDAGDFCVMRRCVADSLLELKEANPFLRGGRSWVGFRQVGIEYERSARQQGDSGYTWRGYLHFAITGLMMFSYIPLRIATYFGLFAAGISFLYAGIITVYWMFEPFDVPGYLSLVIIIIFLGGVQLISIGVIGEYVARLNDNVRSWPIAIVAETTQKEE